MREIKFRLWHEKNGQYLDNSCYAICVNGDGVWVQERLKTRDEGIIIEQYTGMKDCKGNEIYEGDIVKRWNCQINIINNDEGFIERMEKIYEYGVITFEDSAFRIDGYPLALRTGTADLNEDKVVGNIHEHYDLIKTEKDI